MSLHDHEEPFDEVIARAERSGLKDSGQRTDFKTGAQRETDGKPPLELISPFALRLLAKHFERGGQKYKDPRNWEKGLPLTTFLGGALRHLEAVLAGEDDEPHAVAALWNVHCLVHTMYEIARGTLPSALNDLPVDMRDSDLMRQVDI